MVAKQRTQKLLPVSVRTGPSPDDVHDIVYFKRHVEDDPDQTSPGREAKLSFPKNIQGRMDAILIAVAAAPPYRFSGGGYWEAMHGDMTGWFELRVDGPPNRTHYRLFCLLDYEAKGCNKPLLVIVDGRKKRFRTRLSNGDYAAIRLLGNEYFSRNPRSVM